MKKLIVTVGPAMLYNGSLLKETNAGNHIYRINGAHGNSDSIGDYITEIREQVPEASILIDLPGNKIRTANLIEPIRVQVDKRFKLAVNQTNYKDFYKSVKAGDTALADDSTLVFVVEEVSDEGITFISKSDGLLLNNKGLHIRGINGRLPFLFQRDRDLIALANRFRVGYVGLSFVRTADDIAMAEKLIDSGITIIAKVETQAAVENLNAILQKVEHILIDRGDLSADVGLEKIPSYQHFIIEKALFHDKKVFLATQFLKNMIEQPVPSIAEVIDLHNTFKQGVYGIQLSEETAIGKYPRECMATIRRVLEEIDSEAMELRHVFNG